MARVALPILRVAREHRGDAFVDGVVRELEQIRSVLVGNVPVAIALAPDVPLALAHAREVPVGRGPRRARLQGAGLRGGARRDVRRHPGRAHGGAERHRVRGHAPSRGRRVARPRASTEHGSQAGRRVGARARRGHLPEERARPSPGGGVVCERGATASHPSGLAPTRWRFRTPRPSRPMRASGRRSRRAGHARAPPAASPLSPSLARGNDAQRLRGVRGDAGYAEARRCRPREAMVVGTVTKIFIASRRSGVGDYESRILALVTPRFQISRALQTRRELNEQTTRRTNGRDIDTLRLDRVDARGAKQTRRRRNL